MLARGGNRQRKSHFLLEGRHLFDEALSVGWPIESVLIDPDLWPLASAKLDASECRAKVYIASRELQARLGTNPSPEGYIGICEKRWGDLPSNVGRADLFVYLDRIQDPVNVGILVRSAKAFGCRAAIFGPGTADPFSPTALARSAGALLHMPPIRCDHESLVAWASVAGIGILGAAAGPGITREKLGSRPCVLALGNEGHGLSKPILEACSCTVGVPMEGGWDSLNVSAAGSILLSQMFEAGPSERPVKPP